MTNWFVDVPPNESHIGYEKDHLAATLSIATDAGPGWSFKLDMEYKDLKNAVEMERDGDILSVELTRGILRQEGRYYCQLRGLQGTVVKRSNLFVLYIGDSIDVAADFPDPLPSEFEQMERRVTEARILAEASETAAAHSEQTAVRAAAETQTTAQQFDSAFQEAKRLADQMKDMDLLQNADLLFDAESNMLYLSSGGEPVGAGVELPTGGGGGGGAVSRVTLRNTGPALIFSVTKGQTAALTFTWSSADQDGQPTGMGTVRYSVNGVLKLSRPAVSQGAVTEDVTAFLTEGVNTIQVTVTDSYGTSRSLNYSVQLVVLSLASTFDASVAYEGEAAFRFVATGSADKTVHFTLDGAEIATSLVTTTGRQSVQALPMQPHGAHLLRVWATALVEGMQVQSNVLVYDVIWVEPGNNSPIIASAFALESAMEGDGLTIPYLVYHPAATAAAVTLQVDGKTVSTVQVGRTEQVWSAKASRAGIMLFSIRCEETEKQFQVSVLPLDIDVEPVTTGLVLALTAQGRSNAETTRDQWTDHEISAVMTGFNWKSNGWMPDERGDTVLRVSAGARVEIPYQVFAQDCRAAGKTIEVEFATRGVQRGGGTVLSCLAEGIGFTISDTSAGIFSEAARASVQFKEEERLRLGFVVEQGTADRLMSVYVNGILSGVTRYPTGDNFQQRKPVGISIGSDICGVDLSAIRVYDAGLSAREMLDNYIAGLIDTAQKKRIYQDNQILGDSGEVSLASVQERIPVLIITGALPSAKGDKKTVQMDYIDRQEPERSFTRTGCALDVQGTSSQFYPRKNYKFKIPGGQEPYTLEEGAIPERVFCLKADYMESSGKHNTQMANFLHGLYTEKTPPQQEDARIRTTVQGHPIVVFHAAGAAGTPSFLGKYNFNLDKDCEATFGFTNPGAAECWEVCNNVSNRCLFLSDDFETGDVSADFEARYPADFTDYTALRRLSSWILATKDDPERFRAEAPSYFNLPFLLVYYVVSELFAMVDSRTKNLFLATWDKQIWYPIFYDMDTCFGLNNEGVNAFGYGVEYHDTDGTKDIWNGEKNALWNSLEAAFPQEITALYVEMRGDGRLSYDKVLEALDGAPAHVSETLYNEDAAYKYIGPLLENGTETYLYIAQGSRESHRQWWLYNRFRYLDSKYRAAAYRDDYATLRLYSVENGVLPSGGDFTITPYADGYLGVAYGGGGGYLTNARGAAGQPVTLTAPEMTFNDTETIVYGASRLSSLGDLADKYAGTVDLHKAVKLREVILGSGMEGYENRNLTQLTLGSNTLLETVDVRGCTALAGVLDLAGCESIRAVLAQGTRLASLSLPVGGRLETLHLPATTSSLVILGHETLQTVTLEGYENLSTLRLEGAGALDSRAVVENAPRLSRVRLVDIAWTLEDSVLLARLASLGGMDEAGNNTAAAVLTGRVHLGAIGDKDLDRYRALWPALVITTEEIEQMITVTFQDWDGTVLDVQHIKSGGNAADPVTREENPIPLPTRAQDAQYTYAYRGWNDALTLITQNTTMTVVYTPTIRSYLVQFFNWDGVLLGAKTVDYGSPALYTGGTPTKPEGEGEHWVFSNWLPAVDAITGPTDTAAQFTNILAPDAAPIPFAEIFWDDVGAVCDAGLASAWWNIGDGKPLDLGSEGLMTMQIAAFDADTLADGSGKAGISLISKELLNTIKRMNPELVANADGTYQEGTGAIGGWEKCELRAYLREIIWGLIPGTVRSQIKLVEKKQLEYDAAGVGGSEQTTEDTLWVPGLEVSGGIYAGLFPDGASLRKYKVGAKDASLWWLRDANRSNGRNLFYSATGPYGITSYNAQTMTPLAIGFCL